MNDDFLRNLRRPPSATFERQLRLRLREQEVNETSRRRPSWKLLMIAMLVGGSALATATYLAMNRAPSSPPPTATQTHTDSTSPHASDVRQDASFRTNRFGRADDAETWTDEPATSSAPAENRSAAARDKEEGARDSAGGSNGESTRYVSSTGSPTSTSTRRIRIVFSRDLAALVKDTTPKSAPPASFEVDSAENALPALCADESAAQLDIIVTTRATRKEDFKQGRKRSSCEVSEATIGHYAIVVTRAKSGSQMQLSTRTLRLALAKQVPAPDNSAQLIDNPYTHWNQIDPSLEDRRIEVLGPARDTPEFLVFATLVMAPACENSSLDQQLCMSVREDGVYTAARFDANFVPQRLWSDLNVVAIMDYRFYAANSADLLGSLLPGAAPTRESIIAGSYVGARTVRAYINSNKYAYEPKMRWAVSEYLRMSVNLDTSVMIPSDGELDWRRRYDPNPKLTEIKLD